MHVRRSTLSQLAAPTAFHWLAGIEDTFITAPSPKTGRTLDEYELTGHYEHVDEDIALFAELGLRAVRYGIPWHRINPAPGVWDFSWADRPFARLLDLGIQPVVDLVHYGLPAWIDGAYLNPRFADYMAEYAARVAERYRGRIYTYTPLNEPRITAWYCGRIGWWPPNRRSWRGFIAVMLGLCRGIVAAVERQRAIDPDIVHVHVDATDLYSASSPELAAEAERRQELVFLALDLVSGGVRRGHPLYAWLLAHGAGAAELAWFEEHAIALDLVGINLYPLFSEKVLLRQSGRLRIRMPYASAQIVERLAELYWRRYRRPLLISETASEGPVARRMAWLEDSVAATARVRAAGLPLVGYTWWPLFALVTWGYREGRKPAHDYIRQMGLWNLAVDGRGGFARVATPLVDRYRQLAAGGAAAVATLAAGHSQPRELEHVP